MPRTIQDARRLAATDKGLATLATTRTDGTVQASLINAGVLTHPVTGVDVVALVARGGTQKLTYLRRRPRATLTWRAGWDWITVEGTTELVGPDDALPGFDQAALPGLLRDVFTAAGGTHDDWAEYDRVMAAERRAAVLIVPERIYGND